MVCCRKGRRFLFQVDVLEIVDSIVALLLSKKGSHRVTSLLPNLVKRVERLPKPYRTSEALQPLFEAISNSIFAIQNKFGDESANSGEIFVSVKTNRNKQGIKISVLDNGIGLDESNYEAFLTTDTPHKIKLGGKGVGRLLWLDAFDDISVLSQYKEDEETFVRSFDFRLSNSEQIEEKEPSKKDFPYATGTLIKFSNIKDNGYLAKFPGRADYVFQHFFSHFLPIFVTGKSPTITLECGDTVEVYPDAMSDYVYRQESPASELLETKEFGAFEFVMLECDRIASSDLGGHNFIHFIANDRTVISQKIDSKLGLKYFGDDNDRTFHGCLFGEFLDSKVNQERTGFNFPDKILNDLVNDVCMPHIAEFLAEPLLKLKGIRVVSMKGIVDTYPSVAFGTPEELLDYVPTGETEIDAMYGHVSRERFRRDQKQKDKIQAAFSKLKGDNITAEDFFGTISVAAKALEESEEKSLAEYIVRRKAILDFIELLLQKTRLDESDSSYQIESVLHSMICPMRVSTLGEEKKIVPASHDLWVVDERLTFAEYFSSDKQFSELGEAFDSQDRADIIVFNTVHSLKQSDNFDRVLLIELKRPGRKQYKDDENPQHQIERYVRILKSGGRNDVKGRPIKLSPNTIFHCFIVADIIGKMDDWTYSWERSPSGKGRRYIPRDGFSGSVELIGWDELLSDARMRNAAFFDRLAISGESYFSDSQKSDGQ
jgi:hypothetical protein